MKQTSNKQTSIKIEMLCNEYLKKRTQIFNDKDLNIVRREIDLNNHLSFLCSKYGISKSTITKIIYSKN